MMKRNLRSTAVTIIALSTATYSYANEATLTSPLAAVYKANNMQVIGEHALPELENITLTPTLTSSGIIYVEKEKNIVFAGVNPVVLNPATMTLEALDKSIITNYLSTIPNKVIYKAANEKTVLTVFADITCGYCQKVHNEVPTYIQNGVTVEMILYARNGLDSDSAYRMSAIQDSENQALTLDGLMDGTVFIPKAQHLSEQVKSHYAAGKVLEVTGTPVMFLNGVRLNGYVPANVLVKDL
jgi:thiol:disulfide interchange protein DsbC